MHHHLRLMGFAVQLLANPVLPRARRRVGRHDAAGKGHGDRAFRGHHLGRQRDAAPLAPRRRVAGHAVERGRRRFPDRDLDRVAKHDPVRGRHGRRQYFQPAPGRPGPQA
jgi:hypothetical protein